MPVKRFIRARRSQLVIANRIIERSSGSAPRDASGIRSSLVSARHAEFLHNEVPGITIPDATRARMAAAGSAGSEAGIEMADELLAAVETEVAGTYLMPSFGRYEQAAELVRRIRMRHPVEVAAS